MTDPTPYPADLAAWYKANRVSLPTKPYKFPDRRGVGNPEAMYAYIGEALGDWNGASPIMREWVADWLTQLQAMTASEGGKVKK